MLETAILDLFIKAIVGLLSTLILSGTIYIIKRIGMIFEIINNNDLAVKRIEATLNGALKAYDSRLKALEDQMGSVREILIKHSEIIDKLRKAG